MYRSIRFSSYLAVCSLVAGNAQAQTPGTVGGGPTAGAPLYDNGPPDHLNCFHSDFTQESPSDTVQVGDDFVLGAAATINRVAFAGAYAFDNTPPALDDFTIRIFAYAGAPGALLFEYNIGDTGNRTDTGFDVFGFDEYAYEAAIPDTPLAAGTYFLSVVNNTVGENDDWFWCTATNTLDSFERDSDASAWVADDNAYVFSLSFEGPNETGLFLLDAYFDCNADFMQGSATTRTAGLCAPPQVCPFPLAMPALPPGRVVRVDVISWNYLSDLAPPSDQILVNGNPVQGFLVGQGTPDLCWGRANALSYVAFVAPGIVVYGGANAIDGACDGMLNGDPNSLGEGITILTEHGSNFNGGKVRVVELYGGYSGSQSSGTGFATTNQPYICGYGGGPLHMFMNALDGQQAGDSLFINGIDASGAFPGTSAVGDAWVGLAGPCPLDNLYDVGDGNAAPYATTGDAFFQIDSGGGTDCIGMSLVAITYTPHDTGCFGCATARYCQPPGSPNNLATISIDHCFTTMPCQNNVSLHDGPPNQFTYLLVGDANGVVTNPPGAIGDLCIIGGCISRFIADAGAINAAGDYNTNIANSLSGGNYGLPATCGGTIDPGETWFMQYWHRDGMNPSRFSEAIRVLFL